MATMDDVVGVILAGGQARRMGGVDKALLPLAGRPLLAHVIDRFRPQVGRLVLSANGDPGRFAAFGLPVIADPLDENVGPLAGLAAACLWAAAQPNPPRFVATISVDTPFLPRDLVTRLLDAQHPERPVIVTAATAGRLHPVAALHPVEFAAGLLDGLRDGSIRRVMDWVESHPHAVVDFAPARGRDPFANLNTPADLAAAEAEIGDADGD